MPKTGDWKKYNETINNMDHRIKKNCTKALLKSGLQLESMIKDKLLKAANMKKLHSFTIEQKGSSKPLIDDGDLLGSINHRFIKKDMLMVGVKRKANDGTNLAMLHEQEQGTKIKVTTKMRAYLHAKGFHLKKETKALFIPGRPFIKPAYKAFKSKQITKRLFKEAIRNSLKGN